MLYVWGAVMYVWVGGFSFYLKGNIIPASDIKYRSHISKLSTYKVVNQILLHDMSCGR